MRKASLTIAILCLSTAAMSQNLGARNTGMGDVSIGLRDAFSTNNNLYKLSSVRGFSIGISSQNLFLINELQKSNCALHFPIKKGGFGFAYEQYIYHEFNYHQISMAYGLIFNPRFSAGIKLNYTSHFLRNTSPARSFLYPDLGLCYIFSNKIELGILLKNISLSGLEKNSHIISSPTFLIAMLYKLNSYFNFHIESVLRLNSIGLRVGLEYHPLPSLYIRTGINSLQNSVAVGLGMTFKKWGFDLASKYHPVLGFSPGISLFYESSK